MKPFLGTVTLLLCAQIALPSTASAQSASHDDGSLRPSSLRLPAPDVAAQSTSTRKPSSPGRLLTSTLIGAAIGVGVVTAMAHALSDNGSGVSGQDAMSGALYGGLIGAAIGAAAQRRPSHHPSHRRTAVRSTLTPQLKSVSMAVRF